MLRKSSPLLLGFTAVNPDTSPMLMYSQYHWHYNFPQGMERPHSVNRTMPAPFESMRSQQNKYRGVWIELDMHPSFRTALEPQLKKLPSGRHIPQSNVEEVVAEFEQLAPLIQDMHTRDIWLAKIVQLCAFHRKGDIAFTLWNKHCAPRFMKRHSTPEADPSFFCYSGLPGTTASPHVDKPPLPLIKSMLFCASKSDSKGWRPIFDKCLKGEWNYTPCFDVSQWSYLLQSVGRMRDQEGIRMILEEMVDVQADFDRVEARGLVVAFNALTEKSHYEYLKRFLFHLGERKLKFVQKTYANLRGFGAEKLRVPLKENDAVYYHVTWHNAIRQPQQFSPRQLFFDHKPSTLIQTELGNSAKIDAIVKDKIAKWKADGLLPEDYVHEEKAYDRGAAFKNVARKEKWKKAPHTAKSKRLGYCGEL